MRRTILTLPILAILLAGCPAPPGPGPATLPPPTAAGSADDVQPGQIVTDDVDADPAPVLPDPRELLDAADEEPATVDVDPTPQGQAPSVDVPNSAPSPATPITTTESVYSVQILSSSTEDGANRTASQARNLVQETVDVVQEGNLFKVYVGRFSARGPADRLRDHLRGNGYGGAWTKQRTVQVTSSAPMVREETTPPISTPATTGGIVYSVQVFASSSRENAMSMAGIVRTETNLPVEVIQLGGMWKVMVGASADRDPIDIERDRLRSSGYPDAWTAQWQR